MLLYENDNGEVFVFVSQAYHIQTPMGLKSVLSKKITVKQIEDILPNYGFIPSESDYTSPKEEDKPKARMYKHNSLHDAVRVKLVDNSPDLDFMLAEALFQISKITFIYNKIYKPVSVQDLVLMLLEKQHDNDVQQSETNS